MSTGVRAMVLRHSQAHAAPIPPARPYRPGGDAATAGAKSGITPSCANMVVTPIWQLNF